MVLSTLSPSVITHMGRHYNANDLCPDMAVLSVNDSEEKQQPQEEEANDHSAQPSPVHRRKRVTRCKSKEEVQHQMDELRDQDHQRQQEQHQPLSLLNMFALHHHEAEDENQQVLKAGVKNMNYTSKDVIDIVSNHNEFLRLKKTLQKRGAVTNEMLKQGLHFYVMAMKERDAAGPPADRRRRRRRHPTRRCYSEDREEETLGNGVTSIRRTQTASHIMMRPASISPVRPRRSEPEPIHASTNVGPQAA